MDQILHGVLLSDKSDEEKKLCIDHILSCSLSSEQQQSIASVCWAMWPEGSTPPQVPVLVHALQQLPNQFIVCARRYLKDNQVAGDTSDACTLWMECETRHAEWIPVIKVLFLYMSMRPMHMLSRVVSVFQRCSPTPFSTFLLVKDLYLSTEKLASVLIKCGRLPMVGHTGAWVKQFLLLLVKCDQWQVLLTGGNDVILSVAEQLESPNSIHGSLVVLETIFLGFQENADVFLAFFPHFYDRVAPWVTSPPPTSLPTATLIYLHEFLQGLLFAFPGHPFVQAKLSHLCSMLPPLSPSFDVEAIGEELRWKNCKHGDQSPFASTDTATGPHASTPSNGGADAIIHGFMGLRNVGNSCYMNAVLQGLYHTVALRKLVESTTPTPTKRKLPSTVAPSNGAAVVAAEFGLLVRQMSAQGSGCVALQHITRFRAALAAEFQTSRQQDASEFLHYLWDLVMTHFLESRAEWSHVFNGNVARHVTCSRCRAVSTTTEPFLDITVPVPTTGAGLPLLTLLRAQFATETLSGDNAYCCEVCNDRVDATKKTVIADAPPHLLVTLSRFQYNLQR
ncbi:hypothetical protein, variant 1 [Aphanomyces invadans]|nr:hypothetical protein, variant 1 [Aphanomyces invadans]ETV94338.1 hypothetical protein, variant 1 [Aphanomyces invadans]|eukprot:XP_008877099.1 hypothetical protein, variant 1 [Aphanomyces invadans]